MADTECCENNVSPLTNTSSTKSQEKVMNQNLRILIRNNTQKMQSSNGLNSDKMAENYERSFDLNVYDDESASEKEDTTAANSQESISDMIRRMSRTNKWTLQNEKESSSACTQNLQKLTVKSIRSLYSERKIPAVKMHHSRNDDAISKTRQTSESLSINSNIRTSISQHHYIPRLNATFNKPSQKNCGNIDSLPSRLMKAKSAAKLFPLEREKLLNEVDKIASLLYAEKLSSNR
ncbi:unnamed protein product [Thelazia callipaeda]|uniref:Uncharacterized protein n=1 Tax=Thelazia callipaeda TaxID=103827 RepID=A0A0N5CVT3_THECL|nr:unnamed protein product [Thelazia callipaeda]